MANLWQDVEDEMVERVDSLLAGGDSCDHHAEKFLEVPEEEEKCRFDSQYSNWKVTNSGEGPAPQLKNSTFHSCVTEATTIAALSSVSKADGGISSDEEENFSSYESAQIFESGKTRSQEEITDRRLLDGAPSELSSADLEENVCRVHKIATVPAINATEQPSRNYQTLNSGYTSANMRETTEHRWRTMRARIDTKRPATLPSDHLYNMRLEELKKQQRSQELPDEVVNDESSIFSLRPPHLNAPLMDTVGPPLRQSASSTFGRCDRAPGDFMARVAKRSQFYKTRMYVVSKRKLLECQRVQFKMAYGRNGR